MDGDAGTALAEYCGWMQNVWRGGCADMSLFILWTIFLKRAQRTLDLVDQWDELKRMAPTSSSS